jgi:hypothetical protein
MFPMMNPYNFKRIADMRAEEAVRRMRHRRLVREATADGQGWGVRQIALLLRQSGRLLVAAGRRLQQMGSLREVPIERKAPA